MVDLRASSKNESFANTNLITKITFMTRVIDSEKARNTELLYELI